MPKRRSVRPILDSLVAEYGSTIRSTRLLAASTQARTFLVDVADRPTPIVAKLFRDRPGVAGALDEEFESLALMNDAFRDLEVDGWRVAAPEPLFKRAAPPALIMTSVPGTTLEDLLQTLSAAEREVLVRPVSGALAAYWSSSRRIVGDVTLSNILADTTARQLAFVDPGMPDPSFSCSGIPADFSPGSRDLAYLLFDVYATNVRLGLLARRRARTRAAFAAGVVGRHVSDHLAGPDLPAFFAELGGCVARHVARITVGGPLGPWRRYVRRQAAHELTNTLHALEER